MFISFFPRPVPLFFGSAAVWALVCVLGWYGFGPGLGRLIGLPIETVANEPVGVGLFWSAPFILFYLYFAVATLLFAAAWELLSPHPWSAWSVLGSALIVFTTYFDVQVSVAINSWYGPFYDMIQAALSQSRTVTPGEIYSDLATFLVIAFVAIFVGTFTLFFASHYVFRWRTAMNGYYMANWWKLRTIEGASQRVQEDTMRFSQIMQGLGVSLIGSVMTLIAFLPVLVTLSAAITRLPIIGEVSHPLVVASLLWSLAGTGFLAAVGIKLPGLEFANQRVEAAYRKELVYGEDDPSYAQPPTVAELFANVRRNYFRLYFHYAYFNVARILYLQVDNIFPYLILAPTIAAGVITLGVLQQINNAFDQVRSSLQFLVNSWTTIVEMLSVYKRLRGFEAAIGGVPPPLVEAAEPA